MRQEAGDFLEVPAATVKSRLHSARNKLKERMVAVIQDTLRQHAPGAELNERARKVLERVSVVGFELHQREKKDGLAPCPESTWRLDATYVHPGGPREGRSFAPRGGRGRQGRRLAHGPHTPAPR